MRLEKNINNDVEMLMEGIEDRGIFKAVFLAGVSGAGKSYTASKVKSGLIEPRVVNTDTWVEYYGKEWDVLFDTSKRLTVSQLALYLNSMLPLLCDQTSTTTNTVIRRNGILERFGYDTAMLYVNTSLETAMDRISRRERKVPEWKIIEYYEQAQKIKPYLKSKFSLFLEIKNDEGELTDDVIQNVFKRMLFFYDSPVTNPLGMDAIDMMKANGLKYLSPEIYSMSDIKSIASDWYRR